MSKTRTTASSSSKKQNNNQKKNTSYQPKSISVKKLESLQLS